MEETTVGDQEDSAGVKPGGEVPSPETNCPKNCRCLPRQKPGLRNIEGIRERKCRGLGEGVVTSNTASCKRT